MKARIFLNFVLCFFFPVLSFSQIDKDIKLKIYEDTLVKLQRLVYSPETEPDLRLEMYNNYVQFFREVVKIDGSFSYPFDSLKHLGKIVSPDNKVRIYTMNLPLRDGTQIYNGFVQLRSGKNSIAVYELLDNKRGIKDPINERLTIDSWFGCLYYTITSKKISGRNYYILLGVDFNNLFSSKKVIEVLSFGPDDKPVFGSPIFKVGKNVISRVVFEYSAKVNMTLRYLADEEIIVFDHLSPSRPEFSGNFQFYGPDFTYDGFKFEKDYLVYVQDLDLRNPSRDAKKPINAPEKLPEPGFLYKSKMK